MGVWEGKSAQKPRFCARKSRKQGFQSPKKHKNPDFVLGWSQFLGKVEDYINEDYKRLISYKCYKCIKILKVMKVMKVWNLFAVVLTTVGLLSSCSMDVKELEGKWLVKSIDNESVTTVEREAFIEFNTVEGKIHGCLGVNLVNGSFTFDNGNLKFGNMGMTMMMGPAEDMEIERSMIKVLDETAKVKVNGTTLFLMDASGNELASLEHATE